MTIIERLESDQFNVSEGTEVERAYRRGWNAGIKHAVDLLRTDAALRELAYAPAIRTVEQPLVDLRSSMTYDDAFDLGGDA